MKKLLYMICLLFAPLFAHAFSYSDSSKTQVIRAFSLHPLHDQFGHVVDLNDHFDKWLIINYWAPWCSACKKELSEINQFYLTHHEHVVVYGFDYDHLDYAQLVQIRQQMGIAFPLLAEDPRPQLAIEKEIQAIPMTFIYNPRGQLVYILQGPQKAKQLALITQG